MELIISITLILTILYGLTIMAFLAGMQIRRLGTSDKLERVSVIIAARDEEENIGGILQDLAQQNYPTEQYEVIIVNDHSSDNTADIVRSFAAEYPQIKLLNMGTIPKKFSPKKFAIQTAVSRAHGDIILATDADCRVGQEWIKTMVSYFQDDIGFVIGFSQFGGRGEKQNLIERFQAFDFVTMMGVAVGTTNLGLPMAASGQNLGYRKSVFEQVGGYSRVAHRVSGDDVLLLQLVRKYTPHKIVFAADPRTFVVSRPQPTVKAFINQRKRWASNGGYQIKLNFGFFLFLLEVLLFNAALFAGLISAFLSGTFIAPMLTFLLVRILLELAIAARAALYFRRTDLLKYFPLWFIVQIPYIVGVGLAGTFGKFQWKQRVHSAEIKPGTAVDS